MSVLYKQAVAVIDSRTTNICLDVAGQIQPLDQPFVTIAGEFDQTPFHIHCRTVVAPYMAGFVNEQRTVANAELQRRPLPERDKRGARFAPPDRANLPRQVRKAAETIGLARSTPRAVALDIAEIARGRSAKAARDALSQRSVQHRAIVGAAVKVLDGRVPTKPQAKALRETLRDAPLTNATLWRVLPGMLSPTGLKVGGTVANALAATFVATQPAESEGAVVVKMEGGRALPVDAIAPKPGGKYLVGRTLRIVKITQVGKRWIITVTNT